MTSSRLNEKTLLREAFDAAGITAEIEVYEGAAARLVSTGFSGSTTRGPGRAGLEPHAEVVRKSLGLSIVLPVLAAS